MGLVKRAKVALVTTVSCSIRAELSGHVGKTWLLTDQGSVTSNWQKYKRKPRFQFQLPSS